MPLVFQFGSNCTAGRLNGPNRLNGRAEDHGRAQTLADFDITFDVYSKTNGCAASDLISSPGRKAWGVLYELSDEGVEKLKKIEGPRCENKPIRVRNQAGQEVDTTTFLVKPDKCQTGLATSAAYVSWIVYGLRGHGVPEDYVQHVLEMAIETNKRASETVGAMRKCA